MAVKSTLIILLVNIFCVWTYNNDGVLDVGAFNVQVFGLTKMKNPVVRKYLRDIILRYDLILIQEIRDITETAIQVLLEDVRAVTPSYDMVISERLGRTTSKEQYAFIYRTDWLTVARHVTYNDTMDVFERPPMIVEFESTRTGISRFAAIGIHTSPDDAQTEVSNLALVYDEVVGKFGITDVVILGDFNAGCTYINDWKDIKLATDDKFYWLIDNTVDTTTKKTECTYDRVIVAGGELLSNILPLSPKVFRYDEYYNLSQEMTEDISDHYPVQFQIISHVEKKNVFTSKMINIEDTSTRYSTSKIYSMRKEANMLGYTVASSYTNTGAYLEITVSKTAKGIRQVLRRLQSYFHKDFPNFVTKQHIVTTERLLNEMDIRNQLPRGRGRYQTLYNYYKGYENSYSVELVCSLKNKAAPICYVRVLQYFN